MDHNNHMKMEHDESGRLPEGLKKETNAKFPVGTTVKLLTGHMADMLNAKATIVGVFNTAVYSVSYNDLNSGELIKDHKWVIDEETEHNGPVEVGSNVTILATHMPGMKGAIGSIDSIVNEPVYMIDYESSHAGRTVKNHQWVVESEIDFWE